MKKKTLFIIPFFVFILNAEAQNVAQKQMAFVVKKTATWCNPCGTWGWSLFSEIFNTNRHKAVLLELHQSSSSVLYTSTGAAMCNYFESSSGVPAFYVNGNNETQYSTTGGIYKTLTKNRVNSLVDSFAALSPVANAGLNTVINGNQLTVNTKVKFFQNGSGPYYLGVYVAEQGVIAYQNGIGSNAVHRIPFRGSVTGGPMGKLIVYGAASAGAEYTDTFTITMDPSWDPTKIKIFIVIWKKYLTDYQYVNAYTEDDYLGMSEIDEAGRPNMLIYPSIAAKNQAVTLKATGDFNNEKVVIEVFDFLGKKVNTVYEGTLNGNEQTFEINNQGYLKPGMYFVVFNRNGRSYSEKFMIAD